jgi:spoIIIJ-associated protein
LGLGAEEAQIKVRPLLRFPNKGSDIVGKAKETLEKILSFMKLTASVELKQPPLEGASTEIAPITLNIRGEDLGILIGRRGQTLASLQHIVRLIVAHQLKAHVPLTIDVEGYKQRRYQALYGLALRLAERVISNGKAITLEPMPADERRIIHLALVKHPQITTQSIGESESRKVIISPTKC